MNTPTPGPAPARRPLIGVTTYRNQAAWGVWRQPAALLPASYVEAVSRAGAVAVLLPPQQEGAAEAVAALDALVLSGGLDVDPASYGEPAHPHTDVPDPLRDAWEFGLLEAALARDLPVLGVCRGLQVLNAAFGGTLEQHLPDRLPSRAHRDPPGRFARTRVSVRAGSRLATLIGDTAEVACYHHQAVARIGDGLVPTAWSGDDTVEALELTGRRFVLGVQWHPETDTEDIRLFRALTAAASEPPGPGTPPNTGPNTGPSAEPNGGPPPADPRGAGPSAAVPSGAVSPVPVPSGAVSPVPVSSGAVSPGTAPPSDWPSDQSADPYRVGRPER